MPDASLWEKESRFFLLCSKLKANENFLQLQEELAGTENKISYSRQYYNDTILDFNNSVKVFTGKFFASLYSVKERPFLEIAERERAVPKTKKRFIKFTLITIIFTLIILNT